MIQKGFDEDYRPDRHDKGMQEIIGKKGGEGILIDRIEIPSYFDGSKINNRILYSAIRIFNNYNKGHWPHTGGYMDQLYTVYRVTQLFGGEWHGR